MAKKRMRPTPPIGAHQEPAPGSIGTRAGDPTAPGSATPADPAPGEQPDTAELLREIVKDRQKIRQLTTAKSRIDKAIKAIRVKVDENEAQVYQRFEPAEPIQAEDTLKQLELF